MAKLNLDFAHLDQIFDFDFAKHELRLKTHIDGTPRTSMNMQQFYNWYRQKQVEYMWAQNMVDSGGFIGLQPSVMFKTGLKLHIPEVPVFTIHGMIVTESSGEYPFVVSPETQLVISQYSRPHAHVFLSHSSKDKPFVRELREKLYSICDTFFDETDIKPRQSITSRLNEELAKTNLLVLLHSEHSLKSDWVQKEWASMLYMEKPLVVVRLDASPVPPLLRDIKYINANASADTTADGISTALGSIDLT
jgi:hypothetical protein